MGLFLLLRKNHFAGLTSFSCDVEHGAQSLSRLLGLNWFCAAEIPSIFSLSAPAFTRKSRLQAKALHHEIDEAA